MSGTSDDTARAIQSLREFAGAITISDAAASQAVARILRPVPAPRRLRRFAVGATAAALVASSGGMALAADHAVPGDLLYPLDRAMERAASAVGIHVDVAAERLGEAAVLAHRGRGDEAVRLVGEAVGEGAVDELTGGEGSRGPYEPDAVLALVDAARSVSSAARSGDESARQAAIARVRELAHVLAAERAGHPVGRDVEHPAVPAGVDPPEGRQGGPGESHPPSPPLDGPAGAPPGTTPTSRPGSGGGLGPPTSTPAGPPTTASHPGGGPPEGSPGSTAPGRGRGRP